MSEENKTIELKDEELEKVGGGFDVGFNDGCHFNPSCWARANFTTGGEGCATCLYNPHREWAKSYCDYPNEYQAY